MKGPRLTDTQSRGMKDGTTRYATGTPCPVKEPRGHAIASGERYRLTAGDRNPDAAVSPVIAELLFLALTIILAAVISAALFGLISFPEPEEEVPELIKIVSISHSSSGGNPTFASIVTLRNVGYEPLETRTHGIYLSVNGKRAKSIIKTLKNSAFIPTEHYGVRLLNDDAFRDDFWNPGISGTIDFKDNTIGEKVLVTIEVYETATGKIISRSKMYAPDVFL